MRSLESTIWSDLLKDLCVPRRQLEISGMCIFYCVTVEGRVVDCNMDGFCSFSYDLFAALTCSVEVGDVGSRVIVGHVVYVNCTGDMIILVFYSVFQASAGFSYVRKVSIFIWAGPLVDYVLFYL